MMSKSAYILAFVLISCSFLYSVPALDNNETLSDSSIRQDVSYPRQNHSFSQQNASTVPRHYAKKQVGNYSYPTPIFSYDLYDRQRYYWKLFNKTYNWAILGFGVSNFMSYVASFCKNEALGGEIEIISVGSGDGSVERDIIAAYRDHFGMKLDITLVDPNPSYTVDFKTVNDLIEKRPSAVGNCALLIIWPEGESRNDNYDIEAIRKLRPHAVFTLYEDTGLSGGTDFQVFLEDKNTRNYQRRWSGLGRENLGLDDYEVEEVAYQRVHERAGEKGELFGVEWIEKPGVRIFALRMVKLRRIRDYIPKVTALGH